ncbi:hypothetical protein SNE40_006953 [Patella caerulea]|uniref:Prokineticin domain-containing protein n=1 Tax=Patella caerulea TaxID=87958 RepID=A0AAN8Q7E1_PATCE
MFLFLTLVVCILNAEAFNPQPCKTSGDCDADECCLVIIPLKGKRQTASGYCSPRGGEKEKCYVANPFSKDGQFANKCPCSDGMVCHNLGIRDIPQGYLGECRMSSTQKVTKPDASRPCSSGKECGDDECCTSRIRPLGKRLVAGVCQKLGTAEKGCLVKMGSTRPDNMVFQCPCATGFTCKGSHVFDMPLGEMGVCH